MQPPPLLPFSIHGSTSELFTAAFLAACILMFCTLLPGIHHAQAQDLFDLSLEELTQIEVRPATSEPAGTRYHHRQPFVYTPAATPEMPPAIADRFTQPHQGNSSIQAHDTRSLNTHP
jgi:hypothetical protein